MPFSAFNLFPPSKPLLPELSVVFTALLSRLAKLGVASLPSAILIRALNF
jgi:hypothetical protein